MNILFYGFRHSHIDSLYNKAKDSCDINNIYCIEEDESARNAAAERLGISFLSKSYDEMLTDNIDIVAIGTKYGERGRAAIKALSAGKHIIADKPLCTSLDELYEIERLSVEKDLKVGLMLDLRYMPSAVTAKEILYGGSLGKLRAVEFDGQHCLGYGKRPLWYFEEGMHGGTINDIAIHGIDLLRYLTCLEFTKTDFARTWNCYAYKNPHFMDSAVFAARLGDAQILADISYSAPALTCPLPTYWQFRCRFDKGVMIFSYTDDNVYIYEEGKDVQIIPGKAAENDWLSDCISDIKSGTRTFTESVIASTKAALTIQKQADESSCD